MQNLLPIYDSARMHGRLAGHASGAAVIIEAARDDATLGEMMGALREVFGVFDSKPVLARSGC